MKVRTVNRLVVISSALLVPAIAAVIQVRNSSDLDRVRVAAVAARYPRFTVEQRAAVVQELRAEHHPQWKNLSTPQRIGHAARVARRLLQQRATGAAAGPVEAAFIGNQTIIANSTGNFLGLQRQTDCSLTLYQGTYSFLNPTASAQITQTTPHYEQVLHSQAGLTTNPDVFAGGCAERTLGLGSRRAGFLGTTQNDWFLAGTGYNGSTGNSVYFGLLNPASTATQSAMLSAANSDASEPGTVSLAFGDLTGDALADVVAVDEMAGAIHVYLAQANGTLAAPMTYALPGATTEGATIADVNGDGKADVVVATRDGGSIPQQEHLCVLTGLGNGQLNAAQCIDVATPMTLDGSAAYLGNLIAANVRNSSVMDVVGANGMVLLNSGAGVFTATTPAFVPTVGNSDFGPNLVAADFDKDGKLDLAMDDGQAVHIYLGKGDGTFVAGNVYASNSEVGYLSAADLDGDGNTDLYIGLANGGLFGGDQFDANKSYALMGNGDGTFRGAPYEPFVYTGTNLLDLTGDGKPDAVGVGRSLGVASETTFTTYTGNGQGDFVPKSTLAVASVSFANAQGNPYSIVGIDSFGLADVDGDGKPDLVFLANSGFEVRPLGGFYTAGVLISTGDGAGNFAAPTFLPSGHFVPGSDIDNNVSLSGLRLADINGDGKTDLIFDYVDQDYTASPSVYYRGIAVQLGNGDGTFQAPKMLVLYNGTSPSTLSQNVADIADLNGDGKLDLLIMSETAAAAGTSPSTYVVQIALGKGDGTFATPVPVATNDVVEGALLFGEQYPLVIADMNGDGVPDLVTLGSSSGGNMQVAIALGNGDGTFKSPSKATYGIQYELEGLAVGDFKGDGKQDVAVSGYFGSVDSGITFGNGDGTVSVDSTGTAQFNELIYLPGGGPALARDFNGDGKVDLLDGQTLLLASTLATAPTLALDLATGSGTVNAGQSLSSQLTLTPSGGLSGSVALACSGLPQGASCSFSPASVSLNGSPATSNLTISTTSRTLSATLVPASQGLSGPPWLIVSVVLAALFLPLGTLGSARLTAPQHRIIAVLIAFAVLSGCGGGSSGGGSSGGAGSVGGGSGSGTGGNSPSGGTPAGTYTITITATGGSASASKTFRLTVN